jgi:hypothetical protein
MPGRCLAWLPALNVFAPVRVPVNPTFHVTVVGVNGYPERFFHRIVTPVEVLDGPVHFTMDSLDDNIMEMLANIISLQRRNNSSLRRVTEPPLREPLNESRVRSSRQRSNRYRYNNRDLKIIRHSVSL